jgi:hypothetical protein
MPNQNGKYQQPQPNQQFPQYSNPNRQSQNIVVYMNGIPYSNQQKPHFPKKLNSVLEM